MRRTVPSISVVVALVAALPALAQEIQTAPTNPDFLSYMREAKAGLRSVQTVDGHGLGYIPPIVDLSYLRASQEGLSGQPALNFASSYDLRALGRLTPVRDQGIYGTCWAHATFSSMESFLMPKENRDFSENNLANLHGFDPAFNAGGNGFMSMAYLARWGGPVNESDDSYPHPGGSLPGLPLQKHIQNVQILPVKTSETGNDAIKQAVMDTGAVYVNYYHTNTCYNAGNKAYYYSGTLSGNHAVAIVGWDDNFDRSKFNTAPTGNGAFIVRNSWGTAWGENGYYYVSYYDTKMGYSELYAFRDPEPLSNYDTIYQYDPLGFVNNIGMGSTTCWGANLFTAASAETLKAVSFYALVPSTSYEIYIYSGVTAGQPTSGTLAGFQAGTCTYPGYRTVAMNTSAYLASGQRFSVVVKLTTPGLNYPQAVEYKYVGYSSAATASSGQSYYSSAGTSWGDLTTGFNSTANFCIKAFTLKQRNVTVSSPYGPANPTVGTHAYFWGTNLNCRIATAQAITAGPQSSSTLVCTGWTGTGSVPLTGIGTNTGPFTLTTNSTVNWSWQITNLSLSNQTVTATTTNRARDTVTAGNGYQMNAPANVTLSAGASVHLSPGFTASSGTTFRARIGP